MMIRYTLLRLMSAMWLLVVTSSFLSAQSSTRPLSGEKIGVFISSKSCGYASPFFIEIAQFLKQKEDRSNIGKMKSEFIIRFGSLFVEQLQLLTNADTVIFLNGDIERGRAFLAAYDSVTRGLIRPGAPLQSLDRVLVIDPLFIHSRKHRSVFIRSNRVITEYIPVKLAELTVVSLRMTQPRNPHITEVCYDDFDSPKPTLQFDFLKEDSKMGLYLSQTFSQWWAQWQLGAETLCK